MFRNLLPRSARRVQTKLVPHRNAGMTWFAFSVVCLMCVACQQANDVPSSSSARTAGADSELVLEQVLQSIKPSSLDQAVQGAIEAEVQRLRSKLDSASDWGRLGMLLLAHDQFLSAASCLEIAERLDTFDGKWPYLRGVALRTIEPEKAASCFGVAAERYGSRSILPLVQRSELLGQLERYDDAISCVNEALRLDATNAEAILLRAQYELLLNRAPQCLLTLERLLAQPQAPRRAYLLASEAARRTKDSAAALRWQERAAAATDWQPADPLMREVMELRVGLKAGLKRADELFTQQKVDESIKELQQLEQLYPDSEWVHILLGRAYIRTRNLDRAEEALHRALTINPQSFEACFRMGVVFQVRDKPQEAAAWFQKTLAIQPNSAVTYRNLADAQISMQDAESGEQSLMRSVQVQPNYLDGYLSLVTFYAQRGRLSDARQWLEKAERIGAGDERVRRLRSTLPRSSAEKP